MEKRKSALWFRVLALCTAIALGGTYVWRQQQKAVPLKDVSEKAKPDKRAVISSSKSLIVDPAPVPPQEPKVEDRILMPGSKSGIMVPQPETPEASKQRTLLPGSKSFSPVLDPPKTDEP